MSHAKRLSRKKMYSAYCFDVFKDQVRWPNGLKLDRDLIVHGGISVMIPVLDQDHIILIRQYRYGAKDYLWEIPAGTIHKREKPLACAKREIQEEIGYQAKTWKNILNFYASPGFNTEIIHSFVASDLKKTKTALEADEILEAKTFSLKQAARLIRTKKIRDAKSLIPLFYYLLEKKAL